MSAGRDESERKLGEYLVDAQALRREQIGMLLDEQRDNAAVGVHSRIGEIAVRKGWADADQVTVALKSQAQEVIDRSDAGQILSALGWISPSQLAEARRHSARSSETLEEVIAGMRLCSPEKLRIAAILAMTKSASAMRRISSSSFAPYNIMELIVGEATSAAIRRDAMCACSQCWSNVFALALNAIRPAT